MLTTEVLQTLHRHRMIRPGERVLVGLSGGPDSVALACVLASERERLRISLFAAHLDHGMREGGADDEAFCRDLCAGLGVPMVSGRTDVPARARESRRSLEEQARMARYDFLTSEAVRLRCHRIAVGHTADDQAETVLMRLARGSGSRGLAAVYPVVNAAAGPSGGTAVQLVRPLLASRRDRILRFLDERGVAYRQDPTNEDRRFTRNRLRHDLLPLLARELNPRLTETLAETAALLREEEDYLEARAEEAFEALAGAVAGGIELDVGGLRAEHPAIRRRILRIGYERVRGHRRSLSKRHIDALERLLLDGRSGREVHLPRAIGRRSFDRLALVEPGAAAGRAATGAEKNGYNGDEYRFAIPARVPLGAHGGWLSANPAAPGLVVENWKASGTAVVIGLARSLTELELRSPEPTDRFRPLGAPGSKPLRRYLMERRIAKEERCQVPLVARADTREILWVIGHAVSESARVRDGLRPVALEWVRA